VHKRILILDDNLDILEVVTEALLYEQYIVKDISLGGQLLQVVQEFKPNLILLDYHLADASGGDLCRRLKQTPENRQIPVVIFSAYVSAGEPLPADCDGFLYKPFDLAELFEVVRKLLPVSEEVAS